MSKFPDLFNALRKEFEPPEVKTLSKGGKSFRYVTARTVMNRLDAAVGPENWWDEFTDLERAVKCSLSIRLPDQTVVTKCDYGGCANMSDEGDDEKSGASDAFKRAAAKFGVGRYLWGEPVPQIEGSAPPQAQAAIANVVSVAPNAPFPNVVSLPKPAPDNHTTKSKPPKRVFDADGVRKTPLAISERPTQQAWDECVPRIKEAAAKYGVGEGEIAELICHAARFSGLAPFLSDMERPDAKSALQICSLLRFEFTDWYADTFSRTVKTLRENAKKTA